MLEGEVLTQARVDAFFAEIIPWRQIPEPDEREFAPMNVNWGLFPALEQSPRKRLERNQALAARALADLAPWIAQTGPAS